MGLFGGIIIFPWGDDTTFRGTTALILTAVLTSLASFAVAVRLYVRFGLLKVTGCEDWTILAALAFSLVYLGLVATQQHYGLDSIYYWYEFSAESQWIQFQCLWIAIPVYNISLGCTKVSTLLNYLRVFPDHRLRPVCYIMMAIIAGYSSCVTISACVTSVPMDRLSYLGIDFQAPWFFGAVMNLITDIALLIIPIPFLSQLQLSKKQIIALIGVFTLGAIVCVMSTQCLDNIPNIWTSSSQVWHMAGTTPWLAAECNLAITCACLPYLWPLVVRLFPRLISSSDRQPTGGRQVAGTLSRDQAIDAKKGDVIDIEKGDIIDIEEGDITDIEEGDLIDLEKDGKLSCSTMCDMEVSTNATAVREINTEFESTNEEKLAMGPEP